MNLRVRRVTGVSSAMFATAVVWCDIEPGRRRERGRRRMQDEASGTRWRLLIFDCLLNRSASISGALPLADWTGGALVHFPNCEP